MDHDKHNGLCLDYAWIMREIGGGLACFTDVFVGSRLFKGSRFPLKD